MPLQVDRPADLAAFVGTELQSEAIVLSRHCKAQEASLIESWRADSQSLSCVKTQPGYWSWQPGPGCISSGDSSDQRLDPDDVHDPSQDRECHFQRQLPEAFWRGSASPPCGPYGCSASLDVDGRVRRGSQRRGQECQQPAGAKCAFHSAPPFGTNRLLQESHKSRFITHLVGT